MSSLAHVRSMCIIHPGVIHPHMMPLAFPGGNRSLHDAGKDSKICRRLITSTAPHR
jgi:hypothetical protein